ncbi:type I restriction-modification system [Nonlabens ulvanivorans]|uniref:Type I restriction-modification system n=1 Tax=Nonlabens ulvanivorans TaxID=906888 RepID=A0A081D6C6_NONUL|nr:restriction endonuclease subunit S [Nonlabens ulvanivorans]GAK74472.1 type I restriction-modification system [Nonlabens ulvanivorans]
MKMVLQIKAGFKKTKLGWIPKDWEIGTFESLAQIIMGQSPSGDSYNKENIGVPLLNGPTEFKERYPIKKQWTSRPTKLCVADDILICVRGSSTGRINIANDTYCIGRGVAAIRAHNKNDQTYVEHQLNFAINRILKLTSGSTFPNISSVELKKIKICIPQLKERRVIANCLSNWDKAISSLTSLIDKKTEAKKGLLQQLLSGNKRLDGFSVEWETYRIEEIANDYSVKNERNEEIEVLSCTKYDGLVPSLEYFGRQVFGDDLSKYKMVPRGIFCICYKPYRRR